MSVATLFIVIALILAIIAAVGVASRVNLLAAAFACCMIALLADGRLLF